MNRARFVILMLLGLVPASFSGQAIAGDWQGTLPPSSSFGEKVFFHFTDHGSGDWTGMVFAMNHPPDGFGLNAFTVGNKELKFSVYPFHVAFQGKLSADGNTITGAWVEANAFSGKPVPLLLTRATQQTAWRHSSPKKVLFLPVAEGVRLEVIDWGGSGRPFVLLAGGGNTAHIYDVFAPKLAATYHVYGITRRGFGESDAPPPGNGAYSADQLAEDDLAVFAALGLSRPVLAGHSLGGEELSSIGSRQPDKIAALIYLDAGASQSLWDHATGDPEIVANSVELELDQLAVPGGTPAQRKHLLLALLHTSLPELKEVLEDEEKDVATAPDLSPNDQQKWGPPTPWSPVFQAMMQGMEKYTTITAPVLAFFANPHDLGPHADAASKTEDLEVTTSHADLFATRIPGAQVIRIPNASHFIFRSNEDAVLLAIRNFVKRLP